MYFHCHIFLTELPDIKMSKERSLLLCVTLQSEEIFPGNSHHLVDILSCLIGQNYVTFPSLNQLLAVNQCTNLGLTPELRI